MPAVIITTGRVGVWLRERKAGEPVCGRADRGELPGESVEGDGVLFPFRDVGFEALADSPGVIVRFQGEVRREPHLTGLVFFLFLFFGIDHGFSNVLCFVHQYLWDLGQSGSFT